MKFCSKFVVWVPFHTAIQSAKSFKKTGGGKLRWFQRGRLKENEDLKFSEKAQNKYTHQMAR